MGTVSMETPNELMVVFSNTVSAGFDAHADDPLAQLNAREADFVWLTDRLLETADRHSGGRVVSLLEGGYDLDALANSVAAHLRCLVRAA